MSPETPRNGSFFATFCAARMHVYAEPCKLELRCHPTLLRTYCPVYLGEFIPHRRTSLPDKHTLRYLAYVIARCEHVLPHNYVVKEDHTLHHRLHVIHGGQARRRDRVAHMHCSTPTARSTSFCAAYFIVEKYLCFQETASAIVSRKLDAWDKWHRRANVACHDARRGSSTRTMEGTS